MKNKLDEIANTQRKKLLALNKDNTTNKYDETSKEALSDQGKGENNGMVGSAEDIKSRKKNLASNIFTSSNPYVG